jgi:intracellular septation protein A
MRLWTFLRPFPYDAQPYVLEVSLTFSKTQARLFRGNELLAEQSKAYTARQGVFVFNLPHSLADDLPNVLADEVLGAVHEGVHSDSGEPNRKRTAQLMAGFDNGGNLAITVIEGGRTVYESHPGRSLQVDRSSVQAVAPEEAQSGLSDLSIEQMTQLSQHKWQRNKYSIYADMALGALFFIVGKVTEDLALAAIIGAGAGLLLVVVQRFVKVDLLGGFAVFGTIMLLISAAFSLALQDDYWVQMKGTVLGLLTASLFMIDGLLRRGAYFGARIERYMPLPLHHDRIAIGMSLVGVVMALANYYVANHFTEDFWLTWTTFLDLPLSMALFYAVIFWARKHIVDESPHEN